MISRRQLLKSSSAGLALLPGVGDLARASEPPRPFRLFYSNDATHILSCESPYHAKGEPLRREMIEASVDEVAGLVDVHLFQPGLGTVPMWPSEVMPLGEHYDWIRERYGIGPDPFGKFVLDGGDPVQTFIDRCRTTGQVPFLSVRLNDAHHKEYAEPGPDKPGSSLGMSVDRFYVEHPEYRIRPGSNRAADLVLNWAVPEVRARKLALLTELCTRYDLDGLELDFLRFYSFFRLGETSPDRRKSIMTGFVAEVRNLLDRTARGGGRRWLCARVPAYLEALEQLGVDLAGMVAAGLDLVNASSHYFTTQQHDLAEIRRRIPATPLYFELCHTVWKGDKVQSGYDVFPYRRATVEHLRSSAHLAYARGAGGISLFNFPYYRRHGQGEGRGDFGEPPFGVLGQLGDPATVARGPQHWFLAPGWRAPGEKPLPLPREIAPGQSVELVLDLAPPVGGWRAEHRLRIQCAEPLAGAAWRATWNRRTLEPTADLSEPFPVPYPSMLGTPDRLLAWTVPAAALQDGDNRLGLSLDEGGENRLLFVDLAGA